MGRTLAGAKDLPTGTGPGTSDVATGRREETMRTTSFACLGLALAALACGSPAPRSETDGWADAAALRAAVDSLLTTSADAWNAGDLDGFMSWYRRAPETTYVGSVGLVHGWRGIRARYAPLFEPGADRDSLRFEDLETRPLGPDLGLATARYVLFDGDSTTANGPFTLVVRRLPDGWRIVHDHSSPSTE